eukprot:TRINITY_DN28912_c1_g1_i1.p1 TRINITY_DN28912_c1_g1~~TRINITY_DN28912_c1_g1_i1.p1  ORF type:complete len:278 (-),score=23.25 TRINITY_DN28912_c1_g1_i1:274-1107(-)
MASEPMPPRTEAPERRRPRGVTREASPAKMVTLTLLTASGEVLASMDALASWKFADVEERLADRLPEGTVLSAILHGAVEMQRDKTLAEYGLIERVVLTAVIATVPTLHVFQPCSSLQLMEQCGPWKTPNAHPMVSRDVKLLSMDGAPLQAKEAAESLRDASPGLSGHSVMMPAEFYRGGEIVVISNPGSDARAACLQALMISTSAEQAYVRPKTWADHDHEFLDSEFDGLTQIMSDRLTDGFEFGFRESMWMTPMLCGGYTSDGSIVAVLVSQQWA